MGESFGARVLCFAVFLGFDLVWYDEIPGGQLPNRLKLLFYPLLIYPFFRLCFLCFEHFEFMLFTSISSYDSWETPHFLSWEFWSSIELSEENKLSFICSRMIDPSFRDRKLSFTSFSSGFELWPRFFFDSGLCRSWERILSFLSWLNFERNILALNCLATVLGVLMDF